MSIPSHAGSMPVCPTIARHPAQRRNLVLQVIDVIMRQRTPEQVFRHGLEQIVERRIVFLTCSVGAEPSCRRLCGAVDSPASCHPLDLGILQGLGTCDNPAMRYRRHCR